MEENRGERMKSQLRWHWEIGGDKDVLPYSHLKKSKLCKETTKAVKRHQEDKGE
jgi:hypothetical protein